jgi:hypothetical protein
MQSCWAVYTSFPMPPRGDTSLDEQLSISVDQQRDEAMDFNRGGALPVLQLFELLVDRTLLDRARGAQPDEHDGPEPLDANRIRAAMRAYLEGRRHVGLRNPGDGSDDSDE